MILDNIKNRDCYSGLSSGIRLALNFIGNICPDDFAEQTLEIDGRNIYAMFQSYRIEPEDRHLFETHDRYIDLQFILSGEETIRVANRERLTVTTPYDAEKDISFYAAASGTDLHLKSGDFVILFPWDAHAPKLSREKAEDVRKVVVKVRTDSEFIRIPLPTRTPNNRPSGSPR